MTTENKLNYKKIVLNSARQRQQEIIDDFRHRIDEMRSSEMNRNDGQYDHEQQSLNNSNQELIDSLTNELNFTMEEMDQLNKMRIENKIHDEVSIGSIVKTDQHTFYPSVSIEKFEADGNELYGISSNAPLFKAMEGKKAGESFSFNDHHYTIKEVY